VRFEALVEIACADACGDDCGDQEEDCDDGEDGQSLACGKIFCDFVHVASVVHAHEFEDEVGHGGEVDNHHDALSDI
jgi:hypothetical protein